MYLQRLRNSALASGSLGFVPDFLGPIKSDFEEPVCLTEFQIPSLQMEGIVVTSPGFPTTLQTLVLAVVFIFAGLMGKTELHFVSTN